MVFKRIIIIRNEMEKKRTRVKFRIAEKKIIKKQKTKNEGV